MIAAAFVWTAAVRQVKCQQLRLWLWSPYSRDLMLNYLPIPGSVRLQRTAKYFTIELKSIGRRGGSSVHG